MRISTAQLFRQGINEITAQQTNVARTQLELATGTRLLTPASDPAGSAEALRLGERIAATNQHQDNIVFARTRLNQEENATSRSIEILQRVRELAISANDAALVLSDRQAIAAEVEQRLAELVDVANSRDASGEFLFAGFKGRTQPFTRDASGSVSYAGDQGQRVVQVGTQNTVAVADSGFDTFQAIRNGNGTFTVAPATANVGSGVIDPGNVQDASAIDGDTYTITMARDSAASSGAIGLVDSGTNDALTYELRINGTLVDTLNEGDSRTLAQLESAIDAQSGTTGVAATTDGTRLYLHSTTAGGAIAITETLVGASEDADTVTGFFGASLTGTTTPSVTTTLDSAANALLVTDSANNLELAEDYAADAVFEFNGISTSIRGTPSQGDTFTIAPSTNQSVFTTLGNLSDDLDLSGAPLSNALNRALVDIDRGIDNLNALRTEIGARLNTLDSQEEANADFILELETSLSNVQDLDFAEAASRLSRQILALQASQSAFVQVQGLSLFNFLN
ncbi:MAG: flagellar hook-associated protein FlgL [Pseudomonadota bacterium]